MSDRLVKYVLSCLILVGLGLGIYVLTGAQGVDIEELQEKAQAPNDRALRTVHVQTFAMTLETADRTIIDTRTPAEYSEGHLSEAKNIDFYAHDFEQQLAALDADAPYAIYCRSGNRSSQVLEIMRHLGFKDVIDLQGGIVAWEREGKGLCTDC